MRLVARLMLLVIPVTEVAALDLVVDGRSDYAIVLAADAIPAEQFAAEELANHLEEMSGAKLPIVTDAEHLSRHAILLGRPRYLAKLNVWPNWRKLDYLRECFDAMEVLKRGRPDGSNLPDARFLKEVAMAHLRDDSRITDRHGNALHDAAAADQKAGADPLPRSDRSDEYHRHYLIFRSYSPFMAFESSAFAHSGPSRRQIHIASNT